MDVLYPQFQPFEHSGEIVVPESVQVPPYGELLSDIAHEHLLVDRLLSCVNIATLRQVIQSSVELLFTRERIIRTLDGSIQIALIVLLARNQEFDELR